MFIKKIIYLFLFSILLSGAATAYSAQVIVNPGAYQGKWAVDSSNWQYGLRTVDLSVGSHQFLVGYYGRFNIDVAPDGTISTTQTSSATYAGNTLTLLTTTVNIDPGAYTGRWWTDANWVEKRGPGTEVLVSGLQYQFLVGYLGRFNIDIATDGSVSTTQTGSATYAGNTLTLLTTTVNIDPGAYTGRWWTDANWVGKRGPGTEVLVPGLQYQFLIGYLGRFNIDVATDGSVSTTQTGSATYAGNTLTLLTTTVNIDPGAYTGRWWSDANWVEKRGQGTEVLVPGLQYQFLIGYLGRFNIDIAPDGSVSTTQTGSATYAGNTLTLLTTTVNIDPGAYTGQWWTDANRVAKRGSGTEVLVPGLQYMIISVQLDQSIVGGTFDLSSPCGFNPSILTVGLATFQFSCVASLPVNNPPISNAGADQTMHVGVAVNLDGGSSSDPDGDYPLTYSWEITSKPPGSTAALSDSGSVSPSFTPDMPGKYIIELVVIDSKGLSSDPDTCVVSTSNTVPIADAGPDQSVIFLGTTVQLNGTQSYDLDGDPIKHTWNMTAKPSGSLATLSDPSSLTPTFIADVHGDYVIELKVSDLWASGSPDSVTVGFNNIKPVADAGGNQAVIAGNAVYLNGTGSTDANGDALSYHWSLVSTPLGSTATLTNELTPMVSFAADMAGTYVASLVVNDGFVDSDPANVNVMAITAQTATTNLLNEAILTVNNLDPASFMNKNLAKTLTNKLNATLEMIDQGLYQQALNKLQNDILGKTDGCAALGSPDKNDWLTTCNAQGQVYSLILRAAELLKGLL